MVRNHESLLLPVGCRAWETLFLNSDSDRDRLDD
jgi:hypothetical protein